KVGGHYKLDMFNEDGTGHAHTGIYQEIIPNKKIVFTWNSHRVQNTLVTVEFSAINDKTEITLTHELIPTEELREMHQNGWQGCMDNLEQFLMKKNFHCEVSYQAPIEKVYLAITHVQGLKNWWTRDCSVSSELNKKSTFRFGATYNIMKIKELIPDEKVRW